MLGQKNTVIGARGGAKYGLESLTGIDFKGEKNEE
jgi:hypothetical protein